MRPSRSSFAAGSSTASRCRRVRPSLQPTAGVRSGSAARMRPRTGARRPHVGLRPMTDSVRGRQSRSLVVPHASPTRFPARYPRQSRDRSGYSRRHLGPYRGEHLAADPIGQHLTELPGKDKGQIGGAQHRDNDLRRENNRWSPDRSPDHRHRLPGIVGLHSPRVSHAACGT